VTDPGAVTLTLAELYVRQGLIGRAREIYRKLAEAGDETARRRLSELPSAGARIAVLEELLQRVQRSRGGA
jgi:lipopolysaccharide biosynthesis regulator YciM